MDLDRSPSRLARPRDAAASPTWRACALAFVAAALVSVAGTAVAQAPESSAPTAIDVVFVLDNSGSMKTNDPEFLTRRAVSDFTDALAAARDVDGRVGIVVFDGTVRLVQRLTAAGSIASTRDLERTLAELDFSGQRTNSPSAIERALYELRENGREEARRAIVFLSDGRIDTGDPQRDFDVAAWLREDLAGASREEGVLIFGIAFTESADYQLMQEVARRTDARYYRAFAPGELITVVDDVLTRLAEAETYDLATAEMTGRPDGAAANDPPVAAAPLPEAGGDDGFGSNLLGWLPVLLLLAGGGLLLRGRIAGGLRSATAAPAPPAQLLDLGGQVGETGEALSLSPLRTSIGRDAHNDVVLDHDTISSEHAIIEYREGRYWLQDLRSTNGTRRAGERLAPDERVPLKGGDAVRFADVELMFAMKGYVPVGATAYLSSSTVPPLDWSMLAESTNRGDRSEAPARVDPASADSVQDAEASSDAAPDGSEAAPSASGDGPSASGDAPSAPGDGPSASAKDARASRERAARPEGDADPIDAPSGEVVFAEQRGRIDPASVVDLDEALGNGASGDEAEAPSVPEDTFARQAIARAEAVLDDLERQDDDEPHSEPESPSDDYEDDHEHEHDPDRVDAGAEPEIDLEAPEFVEERPESEPDAAAERPADPPDEAVSFDEPTAQLPMPHADASNDAPPAADADPAAISDSGLDPADSDVEEEVTVPHALAGDDATEPPPAAATEALRRGLDFHLARVAELSPAFAVFVDDAFAEEIREALPIAASDLIEAARASGEVEERRYTQDGIRFMICGVDGDMGTAREAFVAAHGGFTRLLMEELQSESFRKERCRILAILAFGQSRDANAEPWVSLSVVPDEGEDPRIDLLSYEFLTDAERQEIEPNLDPEVSQSGLA